MKDNLRMPERSQTMADRYPLFSSILGRLYLLLLSVLIPVVLIQSGYLYIRFKARMASESQADLEMSRAVAGTFSGLVKDILHQELAIGANFTMSHPPSAAEMNQILEIDRTEYPSVRNFSWLEPEGHIIASSTDSSIGLDNRDRDYVQKILSGSEWVVSDLIQSKSTGEPIFTVSRAIRDSGGNLLGIVVAGINPEKLGDVLSLDLAKDGAITIIDSQGMAVYQYPRKEWSWEERNLIKARPAIKQALEGKEITGIFPCYTTGEERLAALSPISSVGWVAGVGRSKEAVMAPVISQLLQQGGAVFSHHGSSLYRCIHPIGKDHKTHPRTVGACLGSGKG